MREQETRDIDQKLKIDRRSPKQREARRWVKAQVALMRKTETLKAAPAERVYAFLAAAVGLPHAPKDWEGRQKMLETFFAGAKFQRPLTALPAKPSRSQRKTLTAAPDRWAFYKTREWQELRYRALKLYGKKCGCCEATTGPFHVDHIKPRSKHPELELEISNLQVLCADCNMGKGNKDETDWRGA